MLLHKLVESRLVSSGDCSSCIIIRELSVTVIGDKAHVKRGITTWVLGRGWYTAVGIGD